MLLIACPLCTAEKCFLKKNPGPSAQCVFITSIVPTAPVKENAHTQEIIILLFTAP